MQVHQLAPYSLGVDRARQALLSQYRGDSWAGTLSSSALATAMSMAALHTVDAVGYRYQISNGRRWLQRTQSSDGGWGDAVTDISNINATSLSVAALALIADVSTTEENAVLRSGLERLEHFGGFEAVGDPKRCTLSGPCRTLAAMAGLMDWRSIKRLRPEIVLLPTRMRRTISTTFPAYLSISILHSRKVQHALNRLHIYRAACRAAVHWLEHAQGPNGSFEESAFLTSVIVTCLTAAGYGGLPWLRRATEFVARSQRENGGWPIDRDLETFDTDLAVMALTENRDCEGYVASAIRDWLLQRQFTDACFATGARPGGWAWAMPAGWPDSDDTAYTLIALRRLQLPRTSAALDAGSDWLAWMQASGGSWSTFVRGSKMPFDHDCPYVTGHAISALASTGRLRKDPNLLRKSLAYLSKAQRPDGSFASIWFRESVAGTASVLEALCDAEIPEHPIARRAFDALVRSQNNDGGWAGTRGQSSTAEETAWALLALLETDRAPAESLSGGVNWLLEHQRPDGTWDPVPIGLYYSAMWYSDSMYALALPLQALTRAAHRMAARG